MEKKILSVFPETQKSKDTFYPTPRMLAQKMMQCVKWNYVKSILEPSAGKGDLAREAAYEVFWQRRRYHPEYGELEKYLEEADLDCIEIDPNLAAVLRDKGFRVVHDDFLTYRTNKRYDLIIMNPPFDDGVRHLLKALDMVRDGGQVVCLLNAQSIKNPYSYDRQQLAKKLKELGATIEYISDAFSGAERGTGVEIAMIHAFDPYKVEEDSMIMDHLRPGHRYVDNVGEKEYEALAKGNFIDAIVDRYNYEVECGLKLIKEWRAISPLINESIKGDMYSEPIISLSLAHGSFSENDYVRLTRKKYWEALFQAPQFMAQLTSNLQNQLFNRVEKLADYEFSPYNIYQLMEDMNKRVIGGIEETIMDLFDDWTRKYHWDENAQNRHYFDGWRTNDAFAVNKRVIIPFYNAYSSWSGKLEFGYEAERKLADIEKVFNYLDGGITEDGMSLAYRLKEAIQEKNNRKIPLKYFYATFYKKGTCHLEFRDMDLLAKFNIFAARHKKWLPPSFGRKRYKDMDREEKAVVDSFMGNEKEYEKIVDRADYFLADASEMLMLPGA